MHAFIIVRKSKETASKKIRSLAEKYNAQIFEFPLNKISDIRDLEKIARFNQRKNIIFTSNIENITTEAANALLKIIEEPNKGIFFAFTTKNANSVLPTILSRCHVINLSGEIIEFDESIKKFVSQNIGNQLKTIDLIKNRENAIDFLESVLEYCEQNIYKSENREELSNVLELGDSCLSNIKANGSVGVHLTNFIIKINDIA